MTAIIQRVRGQKAALSVGMLLLFVFLIYSKHFHNDFHYDDFHTIVQNPYIRDLHNIPRFFTSARTFSVLAVNRTYRPIVSVTLAIDYWLGGGLEPFYFQVSTFFWFLVQLTVMFSLFRRIYDSAQFDSRNWIAALAATAWYGVHPAMAETVNYIIQRGDLYSTLGPLAGILLFAAFPKLRRFGLYFLPVAVALLSKAPALVFPALLFLYIWLFETNDTDSAVRRLREALIRSAPALVMTAVLGWLNAVMTPHEFHGGARSAYAYRITQPLVALRYFRTFLFPGALSANTDFTPISNIWNAGIWAGFLFAAALISVGAAAARKRAWRPVAFGIGWFVLALLPTSLYPLAEVENDHRMFFPLVGLVLAVPWPIALWIYRQGAERRVFRWGIATVCCFQLIVLSLGTMQRNLVWRTEESLWHDVSIKSPRNPRGLMNYALSLIQKGEPAKAIGFLKRAREMAPNYGMVEVNLGLAYSALKQDRPEAHFLRALELDPSSPANRFIYAKWLEENGREADAEAQLRMLAKSDPDFLYTHYLLMEIYARRKSWPTVQNLATYVLERFPEDVNAQAYRIMAADAGALPGSAGQNSSWRNAASLVRLSALYYEAQQYDKSIQAAKEALRTRPNSSDAYNNISAASRALEDWNAAVDAACQAIRLNPGNRAARINLAKAGEARRQVSLSTVSDEPAHGDNAASHAPISSPARK